jgi:uncharacterized protein (DUF305 family)
MKTSILMSVVVAVAIVSGCAGSGDSNSDTTTSADSVTAAAGDTSMGGMAHTPAKDPDHEFLRMMSDHHEGMLQMAMPAMDKAVAQSTKDDAHKLHTKQAAEKDSMVAMIQRDYQETYQPMVMAKNKAKADSLASQTGPSYDSTFYRMTVQHHREGIAMIDQYLPRLTKPMVRQMAEKMKADQQKEIQEFEKKMSGGTS